MSISNVSVSDPFKDIVPSLGCNSSLDSELIVEKSRNVKVQQFNDGGYAKTEDVPQRKPNMTIMTKRRHKNKKKS